MSNTSPGHGVGHQIYVRSAGHKNQNPTIHFPKVLRYPGWFLRIFAVIATTGQQK